MGPGSRFACPGRRGYIPLSPRVVPAKAGTHMWTAPVAQELFEVGSDRLHPYVRPFGAASLTAGQDGFRDASSNQPHDLCQANGSHGLARIPDRLILLHLLLQLRFDQRRHDTASRRSQSGRGRRSGINPRPVAFACRHQLPGDPRHLVGKRHSGKLWRLAFQELDQPAWPTLLGPLGQLDHRGGPDHQKAPQGLITCPGDRPP